ncbi:kinase-like domain-containing protein [Mycena epipterygia]|nr:kinase-like domain-containing protein [Mycena epipterygia]
MSHRGQLEAFQPARYLDHPALGPLNPVRAGAKPRSPTTNEATTPAFRPKVLIYETLISFLKDACRTRIPGRNLSELARFQLTLDGYLVSMPSDSVVSGIVGSLKCRKILLELSSELGLDNDPSLRKALRTDGERIAALLVSIFDSQSAEDAVLRLEGDSAQCFLDAVLDILDSGFLITQEHSRRARRIIRKLSESCDKLPSALFITGVSEREEYPTFGGGYGDIYRASHNNKPVALKHMRHFLRGSELHRIRLKFCREALVWRDLHHPNILPFIGIDRESFPSSLSMVSPWMEHGTILKYLEVHGRANVDKLLFEIAQGLQYLHSRNIVHGDLRGANILINEDWSACLTDFGLSVFSNASSSMRTSTRAGSLYWMAPELIDPDRFGFKFARTPASDVYAFGCVCIEVYTGRPPFSELSEAAALLRTVNGERAGRPSGPPAMSDVLWQNVTAYWAEDRTARPSAEVVVQNMTPPALQKPLPPLPEVQSMPAGSDVSSTLPATAYAYSNVSEYLSSKPAISEDRPSPPFAVSRRKEQSVFPLRPVGGILNALKSVQPGQQLSPVLSSPEERLSENYVLDEKKKSKNFWGRERRDEENELTRKIGFLTATASEDWALVLDVCEHASANESNAKEAVRALRREFKDGEPAAQLSTARLWAIMLRNSSESFVSQSTSRKFLDTVEDLLTSSRTSPVVRERVMDVLAAAAYASGSKKDAGFRGLWRRVKPRDKPEEGMPFDTEDPMFNPPPVAHDYSTQSPPAGEDSDLTRNTGFLNMPLSGVPLSDYNPKSPPADEGKIGA